MNIEKIKESLSNEFIPKSEHKQLIRAEAKEIKAKLEEKEIKYRKSSFIGNLLIALTFVFLGASLWSYFAVEENLVNYFSLAAMISFVVALILKIIIVIKRKQH